MSLDLNKPVAFFDLETTGISTLHDKIVEIAILKVSPGGKEESWKSLINPLIPIPKESSAIHGIHDEDVANSPSFKEVANEVLNFLEGCDLAGYNSNRFDVPMLIEEFNRVNIDFDISKRNLIDVQRIFFKMEKRDLSSALKFYCNEELENAHSAMADVEATYKVLKGQIERYDEIEGNNKFLHDFTNDPNKVDLAQRMAKNVEGIPVFNFGKHKGKPVLEVLKEEPQYYDWIMKSDFPTETKQKLTAIRLQAFNNK